MPIELAAHTDAGGRLVATAERLSETLAADASRHDRDGTFPFEAIDALKAAHYFAAPVPLDIGGLGVCSAHDLVVASSRLARGDASVAIGVNMHLIAVANMERRRQVSVAAAQQGLVLFDDSWAATSLRVSAVFDTSFSARVSRIGRSARRPAGASSQILV